MQNWGPPPGAVQRAGAEWGTETEMETQKEGETAGRRGGAPAAEEGPLLTWGRADCPQHLPSLLNALMTAICPWG